MKKYTFPTCFFVIFTFFQHYLGHFLTLFQLYIITTNRPCEAVFVWGVGVYMHAGRKTYQEVS